jgi:hypothetical protein
MFDTKVKSEACEPFKLQASPDAMVSSYIWTQKWKSRDPILTVSAAVIMDSTINSKIQIYLPLQTLIPTRFNYEIDWGIC